MNIENFNSGIISAAAYSRNRDVAAVDASNVYGDDEGALIVRAGHRRIPSGGETIVQIFAHFGYVLGVTGSGELKWETETAIVNAESGENLFRSFVPARTGFSVVSPTHFIANGNEVYVSNPNSQLKITFESGETPTNNSEPFYVPALGTLTVSATTGTSAETVYLRFQPIAVSSTTGATIANYPIEAVGESTLHATRVPNDSVIDIDVLAGTIPTDAPGYIDVYQSLSTAVNENAVFYWIGRVPYIVGRHRVSAVSDTALETERTLVEPFSTPAWEIAEASNDRLYLNTGRSNRIYMTYNESGVGRYWRTVTDFIDVRTGGAPITGMKIFQQDMLAVYTRNRIFMLNVDPIADNHRVIEVISSRDDRDAPIGCIAPNSIVDINGYHYFLSGNQQVYRYGGQRVTWVSAPINPTLAKVPRDEAKDAIGFARGLTYCLCYPSESDSTENDAMLLYDTQRQHWWKDGLSISDVSKGVAEHEYGVVDDWIAILNTGLLDNEEPIEWNWRGNKILIPLNTLIHSMFIGVLPEDVGDDALELSIKLKTEEGEQTRDFEVESGLHYWQQYVGFNLRGRSVQVTLSGSGVMKIDRLMFNPEP